MNLYQKTFTKKSRLPVLIYQAIQGIISLENVDNNEVHTVNFLMLMLPHTFS